MAESKSFANLKEQYFTLDRNFNRLFTACSNETQRNQFRLDYVISRDNFWEARSRDFIDNDPLVKKINSDLKKANDAIKEMLADLQDIVKILDTISSGVKPGSSLITTGSNAGGVFLFHLSRLERVQVLRKLG